MGNHVHCQGIFVDGEAAPHAHHLAINVVIHHNLRIAGVRAARHLSYTGKLIGASQGRHNGVDRPLVTALNIRREPAGGETVYVHR